MAVIQITKEQLKLMIGCVQQCAEQDRAYIREHGEKRAGQYFVLETENEEHLSNFFDVCVGDVNHIQMIQIV